MSGQPKYMVLSEWIRERIRSGEFTNGSKLLSENELAQRFSMSRQTVRQAVGTLVNEGFLTRKQGSGTYISYQPKQRRDTRDIAVITTYLNSYIFPEIIQGIDQVLTDSGYHMRLGITYNRVKNEADVLSSLLESPVAGIIVEPTKSALPNPNLFLYHRLVQMEIPIVFLNGYYSALDLPHVSADDYAAGKAAAQALLKAGHRKVFGIFKSDDIQGHFRFSGFINTLQDAGVLYDDSDVLWYVTEDLEQMFSQNHTPELLERLKEYTAVVCYNDEIARKLYEWLQKNGLQIPQDLSIVGFDNSPLAEFGGASITSVGFPFETIGKTAASQMVNQLNFGRPMKSISFPPKLIVRNSIKKL
ncbi:GntR family transcriptional regulator [Massilimaliae timonensis]|uniref:GntR family transcriptional regulator n=1 Tax=Massiliimalia timonensis TaxID=1987501 RepID=A0A8J6P4Y9_9FIRM|nr:GntR family transcriptional regulator [Massiliimalia timonensis]MBC8609689.1 GntR family transcriptional regulator [Massiliimalia timonensis]